MSSSPRTPLEIAQFNLGVSRQNLELRKKQDWEPEWREYHLAEAEEAVTMWERVVLRLSGKKE